MNITKKQKTALIEMSKLITAKADMKSATNDVLRPLAAKLPKKALPDSFKKGLPENNDPISWGEFTFKLYGVKGDSPVWDWLFDHRWATYREDGLDTLALFQLADKLEAYIGVGFHSTVSEIVNDTQSTLKESMIKRVFVLTQHLNS